LLVKHERWQVATHGLSVVGLGLVLGIYAWVLLIVMRQKQVYRDVLSQLFHGLRLAREKRQIGHELDRSVTNWKT
jgi:hypothetical protein